MTGLIRWQTMEPTVEPAQFDADSGSDCVRPPAPFRCCLLPVGQEYLTVDLSHMCEVFKVESITPVPGMPPVLVGVANLRGSVIPMADIRPLLGLPCPSVPKYAAVVRQEGVQLGILIDEVPEIYALQPGDTPDFLPKESASAHPFLSGRITIKGRTSVLLDVSKLLATIGGTVDSSA